MNKRQKKVFESMLRGSKTNFLRDGMIVPTAILFSSTKEDAKTSHIDIIEMDMENEETKSKTIDLIRDKAAQMKADMVILIIEAWVLRQSDPNQPLPDQPVRNHPDREEAIVVSVETTSDALTAASFIDRSTNPPTLGEWDMMPAESAGRMAGIIPRPSRN